MGAPCWSLEEREYFVQVILPLSKYAGGTYTKPEGLTWGELAAIMQEELDRKGVSRRKYTSDMLFQHYYQKCSSRSYKRGEGDNMVVPGAVPAASSGSMNPPPRPAASRRRTPATKKPSKRTTYATKGTQTEISIKADSESDRALQGYPKFAGPLATEHGSDFEVQPVTASSGKRKFQVTVEDEYDQDDEEYDFLLKEEFLEEGEPVLRKKKNMGVRANGSEAGNSSRERTFSSIGEISEILGTRSSGPARVRPSKLQNPWAKSSGARSPTALGGSRGFGSPSSDTHSAGTSTIAYKTYPPTPSFEPPHPLSESETTQRLVHGFNMAKALLEERSRPATRASNRSESSHGVFQPVASPLREPSGDYGEELGIRGTSRNIRSPAVGPSRSAYRYNEDFSTDDFLRSRRHESSDFAAYREEQQTSRFPRSPQRESSRFAGYREEPEAPTIPRTSHFRGSTPPPMSTSRYEEYGDHWYSVSRTASQFDPSCYQGESSWYKSSSTNLEPSIDDEPIRRSDGQSSRFHPSPEPRNGNTETPITTPRPATPSCPPLSNFRIRKRSKVQPSSSFEQHKYTPQAYRPIEKRADPSTSNGLDAEQTDS